MVDDKKDTLGRLRFAKIDDGTKAQLRELWPLVQPMLPKILSGFYAHVKTEPKLAALVGERADMLKKAQETHWARLFSGAFDENYVDSIDRIGRAHVKIDLPPRWYIGGYQYVLNELVGVILAKYRFSPSKARTAIVSLNKAVMMDLDFAISTYQEVLMEQQFEKARQVSQAIEVFKTKVEASIDGVTTSAHGVTHQADNLSKMSDTAMEESLSASSATEETTTNIQTIASATEQLSSSIAEISRQISGASDIARRANSEADNSSHEVGRLSESATRIGDVISLIQAVAEQTNLLALNATIEAARAGDAGKGFAVVAAEVKQLADQTSKATEEIAGQIASIQAATGNAVKSINAISETVKEVDNVTATLAAAVEEQGAATREISANIQSAAAGSRTLAGNVSEVNSTISETGKAAKDFLVAADDLRGCAARIADDVQDFFVELRSGPLDRRKRDDPNYRGPERREDQRAQSSHSHKAA